jgi:alpha-mannosidase
MRYSLTLHDGPADPASLTRLGAAWNHPFLLMPANLQHGTAPASYSFARVVTPGVVLTALKQADDGQGDLLRLVELNGADTEAVVELSPDLQGYIFPAPLADLLERPNGEFATLEGSRLRVPIKANSFATVRLGRK